MIDDDFDDDDDGLDADNYECDDEDEDEDDNDDDEKGNHEEDDDECGFQMIHIVNVSRPSRSNERQKELVIPRCRSPAVTRS